MKGVIISELSRQKKQSVFFNSLNIYLLVPMLYGLMGFGAFFTTLIISRLIGYLSGFYNTIFVDLNDLLISLLGFGLLFLIKILENSRKHGAPKNI